MKLYLVDWRNNYGLDCIIIEAESEEQVKELVKDINTVWDDYDVTEIIITGKAGNITYPSNQP